MTFPGMWVYINGSGKEIKFPLTLTLCPIGGEGIKKGLPDAPINNWLASGPTLATINYFASLGARYPNRLDPAGKSN